MAITTRLLLIARNVRPLPFPTSRPTKFSDTIGYDLHFPYTLPSLNVDTTRADVFAFTSATKSVLDFTRSSASLVCGDKSNTALVISTDAGPHNLAVFGLYRDQKG
jgi:hypothetical protein